MGRYREWTPGKLLSSTTRGEKGKELFFFFPPVSQLTHKHVASSVDEYSAGTWHEILGLKGAEAID